MTRALFAFAVFLLSGCASQQAYQGYLSGTAEAARAYYTQGPLVEMKCEPSCTVSGLVVRAPLGFVGPQQIINENAGVTGALVQGLTGIAGTLGKGNNGTADVLRAAGEAFKTPQANVTTTTTTTAPVTTTNTTNTSTTTSTSTPTNSNNTTSATK